MKFVFHSHQVVDAENSATMFELDEPKEISDLGDADTYVIYPTTEKSLYRAGFSASAKASGNLKNRQGECTHIYGF